MALALDYLDVRTRPMMLQEVKRDIDNSTLFYSARLSDVGHTDYPALLMEAVKLHDDDWLADRLGEDGRMNYREASQRKGKPYQKRIPGDAHITLAEGEFNRFYIRGMCLRALEDGAEYLLICRVKHVGNPRPDSESKIGEQIPSKLLLADLRTNVGIDTAFGLPAGPNSGLSVTLP